MSEFFSNGKHTIGQVDGNTALNKTINITINGLYVANNTGDKVLNSLHIKKFGHITHNGNLTVLSSLKVDDGGYLFVKGVTELGSDSYLISISAAKISNGGKMYLMGGLDIINSAARRTTLK